MTNEPRLACLCPTYKRPNCVANVAACFLRQTYPVDLRRLFVLDDAGQYRGETKLTALGTHKYAGRIRVESYDSRYPTLPAKFDRLVELAKAEPDGWQPDAFVVWEDDDVFLPWHLQSIADAILAGGQYLTSHTVHSTYEQPMGDTILEGADGRFHSSWAFTANLLNRVGGYPHTDRLDFDQQLGTALSSQGGGPHLYSYPQGPPPSYVYRWGNGIYHGSQQGEQGFRNLWSNLDQLPAPYVGTLEPNMDRETTLLYRVLQCDGLTV